MLMFVCHIHYFGLTLGSPCLAITSLTLIHADYSSRSVRLMRSVECRSWLFHGSSGWENQLLPHQDQLRNWITLSKRVKMISPCRTWLVDLDVFGQWAFLHVRHPAVQ